MGYHPICYFIGRWEGKDFHYVAEVSTRELAEKVAEITGREILSDDDADPVENFIRDYGNQESDDTAAKGTDNPTRPLCSSCKFCSDWTESGCGLKDPANECDYYAHHLYFHANDGGNT